VDKRKRNYRDEYDQYHGTDEQKKRRARRNRDRRRAVSDGRVKKGDKSKEIHHKDKKNLLKPVVRGKTANRKDQ